MKILTLHIKSKLAMLFFLLILLNNAAETLTSSETTNSNTIANHRFQGKNMGKINELKFQKKTHLKKYSKYLNQKTLSTDNKEKEKDPNTNITEEQLKFIENMTKSQQKNDSFMYASWFIFVPLVLLIFIMTILSIAGFLILILNSTNTNTTMDKKEILRSQINRLNRSNLSNQEILDILRKKNVKKNRKNSHMNYKPEPEPENILLGI